MRRAMLLAVLASLAAPARAGDLTRGDLIQADDLAEADREPLVRIFVSLCVHAVPDLDRIEASAIGLGLKEITALDGTVAVPAGADGRTRAWRIAGGPDGPASLNIAEGRERNKTITVCAIVSPTAASEPVERALKDDLHLERPFRRETDGDGQASIYWNAAFGEQKMVISTTDRRPASDRGVNLAATVVTRR